MKKNNHSGYESNRAQPEFWQPIAPKANGKQQGGPGGRTKGAGGNRSGNGNRGTNGRAMPANGSGNRRGANGKKRPRTKKEKIRLALIISGTVLLVLLLAAWLFWRSLMGQMNLIDPDKETIPEEYDVPTESLVHPIPSDKNITNILLLGIDARDPESISERSDAMMILTIDQKNKTLKLTSLQRDMLVYLPGKDQPQKINSANVAGGPALAMRVVNETLRLDISNYVVVNMKGMEEIVEIAGGVMIDVTKAEIPHIPGVSQAGLQKLNGHQAVSYARIRAVGTDYGRMQRQRTLMQALLDTFMQANLATKANMISEGLPFITTNLSEGKIMDLGLKVLPIMRGDIGQLQIPIDGFFREYSGASWVNLCDFNGMIPLLQEYIWGRTFPFDRVKEIPGAPNGSLSGDLPWTTTRATNREPAETTTEATTEATTTAATTTTLEMTTMVESETTAETTTEPTTTAAPTTTTAPTTTAAPTTNKPTTTSSSTSANETTKGPTPSAPTTAPPTTTSTVAAGAD